MAKKRTYTPQQIAIIRRNYAKRAQTQQVVQQSKAPHTKLRGHVGEVYRGITKYIDTEPKSERNFVVVQEDDVGVGVAKLKSIKHFDENGHNADRHLQEINQQRYGLEKRTGVDTQVFSKNRMTGKALSLNDEDVFPEGEPRFRLGSHDTNRVLVHTGRKPRSKKKR